MKKQTEKSQIFRTYLLLIEKLIYMYLGNREKSLIREFGKRFLLDIKEETYIKFMIFFIRKIHKTQDVDINKGLLYNKSKVNL